MELLIHANSQWKYAPGENRHLSELEKAIVTASMIIPDLDVFVKTGKAKIPSLGRIHAAGEDIFHNYGYEIAKAAKSYDGAKEIRQMGAIECHMDVDLMGHSFLAAEYDTLQKEISQILGREATETETHAAFERLADQEIYSTAEGRIAYAKIMSSLKILQPRLLEDIVRPRLMGREPKHMLWEIATSLSEFFKTKDIELSVNDLHFALYVGLAYMMIRLHRKTYMYRLPKSIYMEHGHRMPKSDRLLDRVPGIVKEFCLTLSNVQIQIANGIWPDETDPHTRLTTNGNNYNGRLTEYAKTHPTQPLL
ncbi:MAG: hypothetical protein ABIF10_07905 [Candidatus Woesearchaeota archaeon]